ncbi:MAG: hypothetical protein WC588_03680, partial [Candidatus Micrarchaeia archaeon]
MLAPPWSLPFLRGSFFKASFCLQNTGKHFSDGGGCQNIARLARIFAMPKLPGKAILQLSVKNRAYG